MSPLWTHCPPISRKRTSAFTDHAIYTSDEVHARYNIHAELHWQSPSEARTMIDMLRKDLPLSLATGPPLHGPERRKAMGLPPNTRKTTPETTAFSPTASAMPVTSWKDLRNIPADPGRSHEIQPHSPCSRHGRMPQLCGRTRDDHLQDASADPRLLSTLLFSEI